MNVLNPLEAALSHLAATGEIPIGIRKNQILDGLAMLIAFHLRDQPGRFINNTQDPIKPKVQVLSHSDLKHHWEAPELFDERPGNFYISPDVYANHGVLNIVRINNSNYSRVNTFQFSVDCDNHGDMFNTPWPGKKWYYKSKSLASALGGGGVTLDNNINNKQNEKKRPRGLPRESFKEIFETKRVGCFLGLVGQLLRLSERLKLTNGDLAKAAKANKHFSKSITKQELMANADKTCRFFIKPNQEELSFTIWAKSVKSSDILMRNHNYSSHSLRLLRVSAAASKNTKKIDANVKSINKVRTVTNTNAKNIDTNVESINVVRKILNVGFHSLIPMVTELQDRVVHLEAEKKRRWIPQQQFNTNWVTWCSKEDLQMKNPFLSYNTISLSSINK